MNPIEGLKGEVLWRGQAGYEEARVGTVWNARKPDRYPSLIVRAADADDVAIAVRYAVSNDLAVRARSGGHNWNASSIRDDAMLIDLGHLADVTVDTTTRRVSLGPAIRGNVLQQILHDKGLFFPTGHCSTVAMGGFLLQGGLGWQMRRLGLANEGVRAIDVVTATGEQITASATENEDYFWAARGSHAGFFGIITRYHLEAQPRPEIHANTYLFSRQDTESVLRWAVPAAASLDPHVEVSGIAMPGLTNVGPPGTFFMLSFIAFTETAEQGIALLRAIDGDSAVLDTALVREVAQPSSIQAMYDGTDQIYIEGLRFNVDNMYTSASDDDVVSALLDTMSDIPTPMPHVLWSPFPENVPGKDTQISILGNHYIALYGASFDPADDDSTRKWSTEHMRATEHISDGMQLGDENLIQRPHARILAGDAERRLEELRTKYDPDGRFLSYLRGS